MFGALLLIRLSIGEQSIYYRLNSLSQLLGTSDTRCKTPTESPITPFAWALTIQMETVGSGFAAEEHSL